MNELVFFIQILVLSGFAISALKIGKEALITWVGIQALIANLFVLKQITLFGLDVTASDAFAIGSLLGLNLLQEYFNQEAAQKATWICFFFMLFFALVALLHLAYIPNVHDSSHLAFSTLLTPVPRLFFASISVFFLVQQIDIRFFVFLKKKLPSLSFVPRAAIALSLSQALDTILFSFAGLYGVVASIAEVILFSFIIKMLVVTCCSSILKWGKI